MDYLTVMMYISIAGLLVSMYCCVCVLRAGQKVKSLLRKREERNQ